MSPSVVAKVDPNTGSHHRFISGLKTAIDVLAVRSDDDCSNDIQHLVLEFASGDILRAPDGCCCSPSQTRPQW